MRPLYVSEARALGNLFRMRWGANLPSCQTVHHEIHVEPRDKAKSRFNMDFVLEFGPRPFPPNTACAVAPILPGSMGPAISTLVDIDSMRPLLLELMFGDSIGIEHLGPVIKRVESELRKAVDVIRDARPGADHRMKPDQSIINGCAHTGYARLMVVHHDVCFLLFPGMPTPAIRGVRRAVATSNMSQVVCYQDGDDIVCLDGWVCTGDFPRGTELLVAIPEAETVKPQCGYVSVHRIAALSVAWGRGGEKR